MKLLWGLTVPMLTLSMVGCSDLDDFDTVGQVNTNTVSFTDGDGSRATVETTASLRTSSYGVGVFGYYDDGNAFGNNAIAPTFMYNQQVTYDQDEGWVYTPLKLWPDDDPASFFAYAPYTASAGNSNTYGITSMVGSSETGHPYLKFQAPTGKGAAVDLLYASSLDRTKAQGPVPLRFRHALTKISYSAQSAFQDGYEGSLELVSVTFSVAASDNFTTAGTLDLYTGKWSNRTIGAFSFTSSASSFKTTTIPPEKTSLTKENAHLMIIPHISHDKEITEGSTVTISVVSKITTPDGSVVNNNLSSTYSMTFVKGRAYDFNLKIGYNSLVVEPDITDWDNADILDYCSVSQDGYDLVGSINTSQSSLTYNVESLTRIKDADGNEVSDTYNYIESGLTTSPTVNIPATSLDFDAITSGTYRITFTDAVGQVYTSDFLYEKGDYMLFTVKATSSARSFTYPFTGDTAGNGYLADWGDGNRTVWKYAVTEGCNHTYSSNGEYQVKLWSLTSSIPWFTFLNADASSLEMMYSVDGPLLPFSSMPGDYITYNPETVQGLFRGCTSLCSLSEDTFARNAGKAVPFYHCFANCTALQTVPEGIFSYHPDAKYFNYCFSGSAISDIKAGLFSNQTGNALFISCFEDCDQIVTLPGALYSSTSNATSFDRTFFGCDALQKVPANFFSGCTNASNFHQTFSECQALTEVGDYAFAGIKGGDFGSVFYNCPNLETLGAGLFQNTEATTFRYALRECPKLTTLPDGIFSNCSKATIFNAAFLDSPIAAIPSTLFDGCSSMSSIDSLFMDNTHITEIPANWLQNKGWLTQVLRTFSGCTALQRINDGFCSGCGRIWNGAYAFDGCTNLQYVPSNMFQSSLDTMLHLEYCFNGCSAITSALPEWWNWSWADLRSYQGCFAGCTSASNSSTISSDWQ